jgi:ribosome-associated protein
METVPLPLNELQFSYARSGGPGGQNVNKVSSKVLLRWNPAASAALPPAVKDRLLAQLRGRLTREGDLLILSQKTRDQERNRQDCLDKLRSILDRARRPPKVRKPTRPSRASREARLEAKKRRAQKKSRRRARTEE